MSICDRLTTCRLDFFDHFVGHLAARRPGAIARTAKTIDDYLGAPRSEE